MSLINNWNTANIKSKPLNPSLYQPINELIAHKLHFSHMQNRSGLTLKLYTIPVDMPIVH